MTSPSDNGPSAGFTLIEMIIVIAILGLLIMLVMVRGTPASPALHARAGAQAIAGGLRAARSEAVLDDIGVEVTFDLARRTYRWSHRSVEALPSDIDLALLTNDQEAISGAVGRIRFHPDGSSSGGRLSVRGGGRTWWVGVDWLTGQVSLVEKPR
jgi:general secretion pathway protein H